MRLLDTNALLIIKINLKFKEKLNKKIKKNLINQLQPNFYLLLKIDLYNSLFYLN